MKKKFYFLTLLLFLISNYKAQTYIQNVTVVDVINQKLIPNQTVILTKNIISEIKPSKKGKIPNNSKIINGEGKFLIPGMTDSHVHFFQSGGIYTRPDALDLRKQVSYEKEISWVQKNMEDFLSRYLKLGITSVIDVGSTYNFLNQKKLLTKESLPTVYMTGPLLTTYEPEVFKNRGNDEPFKLVLTTDDAKKMVQEQLPFKPDFIKIWYIVSGDNHKEIEADARKNEAIIKSAIDEAHKNNLKVAVHATERITAQIAIENGADFLVHNIEDEIVSDSFVKLLKSKNTILNPTLIVADNYYKTYGQKHNYTTFELNHSNPEAIGSIDDLKHLSASSDSMTVKRLKTRFNMPQMNAYTSKIDSIRVVNLKKLSDGGVIIAAGTDAGNIGTQHATSFILELNAMKNSGMSNWQVLQSATINPMKIFNREKISGSISEGKIADLVLLDSNPIENLDNLNKVNLVFKNGEAIDPEKIIKESPEMLVQKQVNGYNARNIDAFLEPYSEEIELYMFPNQLISKGKEAMRKDYSEMFKKLTNLHCHIKNRIVNGNFVIDQESVSGMRKNQTVEATAIYEIKDNKISKVYFLQ
ncbi:amidohydrolase family protein [Chryseobacterium aquaticum]|uniref:Amidohydrolase family protein n=1 Tax=Chryseobacterium aquaticum TaxID=452084 RepID=A0A848N628_9FLAO|nr:MULTISPECIES: amidohydrolase family protein [Chryseobacterium]NMR34442.1 amidohydrolase family protein [Chryseobacterium aquaticum]NRQ46574.1 amidohydrolase family protein [Chryseobacterium sp. C-204]